MAGPITDYASLSQAILDWSHRANLASYTDYFIQNAQNEIERAIPDLNFGNYIAPQEVSYGPFAIANGVAPVPADWLGPKVLLVNDIQGNQSPLSFKSAAWIYDAYPQRQAQGPPSYAARDVWQSTYAQPQTFTATANQTAFTLSTVPNTASILIVSLDGASLTQGISYTLAGNVLTLLTGANVGQVLAVQYLSTVNSILTWTATASQVSFPLSNPVQSVIAATLDGSILNAGTDYTVAGGYITLTVGAVAGQILTAYMLSASVLVFGPYPDAPYFIQGTYYAKAPRLAATRPTNWMVNKFGDGTLDYCMREVAKFLKDKEMYSLWDSSAQTKLKELVDQDKAERWAAALMQVDVG